ncbi:MAG: tetratricopeptide repeat protein [Candidatus Egerieousia sp.]|nr:tetratricopeptide repeat protein [Candidatus Egerieousia sp.]
MKKSVKIILAALVALMMCGVSYAQELSQAAEMYNNAVNSLNNGDDAAALESFQGAYKIAVALGEEGAALANDCKAVIPKVMYKIGKTTAAAGDYAGAETKLAEALKTAEEFEDAAALEDIKSLFSQVEMALGNTALSSKDYATAIEKAGKAVELNPSNTKALVVLGMAKVDSGDEAGAVEAFTKAKELGDDSGFKQMAKEYLLKANAAMKAKDFNGAVAAGLKSIEFNDTPNAHKIVGISAFNAKKYDQAIKSLEVVVSNSQKADNERYYLARAYEAKGNNAKACENYKAASNAANKQIADFCKAKAAALCK